MLGVKLLKKKEVPNKPTIHLWNTFLPSKITSSCFLTCLLSLTRRLFSACFIYSLSLSIKDVNVYEVMILVFGKIRRCMMQTDN